MKAHTRVPSLSRAHRHLALLVLVVAGAAIPFLSQPFHMDDNFYMDMARSARSHPLFPYDAPYDFGGFHVPDMASHSHPPLQSYFLAMLQSLAGEGQGKEWIYHAAALVFPLGAVIAFYFLAARFVERPLWPALALAVCPLLMVMEHTLMTDVPMLAYWLAAVTCFLWATDLNSRRLYLASSVFLFAAIFTSYQAVAIVPLLGFYQIRRRERLRGWIALIAPLAVLLGWLAATSMHYGRMILGDTIQYVQSYNAGSAEAIMTKALAILGYQGWLLVFPLFLLYAYGSGLKGRLFALVLLASVYLAQMQIPFYRFLDKAIFVVGLATGILVALRILALSVKAFRRGTTEILGMGSSDARFLALWYFGVAAYCVILFTSGSARYILPLVPPLLIFFFRSLEIREISEYRAERAPLLNSAMVASGSIVLSLVFGLFLSQADFEFARVYPRAAAAFSRLSVGLDSFVTGEWGFRYYFNQAGARPLPADESAVAGGSLLVKPQLALPFDPPSDLASMTLPFARYTYDLKTPFRTMDTAVPAGFYSTGWGMIPFSFSSRSLETIDVRQVSFFVERLPWARVESKSAIRPWPGFARTQENVLALLAKPGTLIMYPWASRHAMYLELQVGILSDSTTAGAVFDFSIEQRDAGKVLARYGKSMDSSMPWQPVKLLLLPCSPDGLLELRFSGQSDATGAFAGALIVPR